MTDTVSPDARFMRAAQLCRMRDLERLSVLGELVHSLSTLIHALQRERGASSIVLGSHGASFRDQLIAQVRISLALEEQVRERLDQLDRKLDGMSFGARFYLRGAMAYRLLDTLAILRAQIADLRITSADALKAFADVIGSLLAVGFEVSDIAADPQVSRSLIALANFAQGKEYAGQERATAGAGFSAGRIPFPEQQRLRQLIGAQDQAFRIFAEFGDPPYQNAFQQLQLSPDTSEVKRLRRLALTKGGSADWPEDTTDAWFRHSTARIDAMRVVEEQMTQDLNRLCGAKLAEARAGCEYETAFAEARPDETAPVAMLVPDVLSTGVGLYTLGGSLPKPMRSIMDVVQAQSRQLTDVNHQLESARAALTERKTIERAKGLLMANRRLSEKQAYDLLREAAMSQNKRLVEIAEAVIGMAGIL
ncbi:MAG TPA: nitrate- and nitrite sensing domain-containing protein [Steroidobacteraceae bacterium]|nr:nitrate- and nitrite sensing domain-containing protein [Steroidobacteraceae bacterium]